MYLDCRSRTQRLWDNLNGQKTLDRYGAESAFFSFRMWVESFVAMIRYGLHINEALSRRRRQEYLPRHILSGDKERLDAIRLISLSQFAVLPPEKDSDIGFTIGYESFYQVDVQGLASLHGQLGNFTHVTSAQPDAKLAQDLLTSCYATYGQIAPLMKRHLLELRGPIGASEANIDGIHLVVGQDDEGGDWLIEKRGNQMSIRVRPS